MVVFIPEDDRQILMFYSLDSMQVILAGTLTGVQGDIRCKVLAVLERDTSLPETNQDFFGGNAYRGTWWHSMQSFGGPFHSK